MKIPKVAMMRRLRAIARLISWLILALGGLALLVRPARAQILVTPGLATAAIPLALAWRSARGTALRPAIVWASVSVAIAVLGQIIATREPMADGRPWTGHLTYLSTLAGLASLITVLNARRPGGGAWAILMGLLVLVFLIPWLEGSGLSQRASTLDRLRLEMPWSLFFALLILAGATNYLPTRHGPAALAVGVALALELAALVRHGWPALVRARLWSVVPWLLAVSLWLAESTALRPRRARPGPGRLWLWFRDAWGVVWAIRIQERFNRAAEAARWPTRLTWSGLHPDTPPPAAEPTLKGLLRRFADPERLDEAAGRSPPP